eukprot:TRINITY_DN40363_c0_g1_i1.p1 TRINITY_DN40363_c0_g1~~TRINITY_DN40363_c0_g1_i1.p1  ORF type:complete len:447 (-),score=63.90 TRINITY_DN40363_c0_g1_i1:629-1861(-)
MFEDGEYYPAEVVSVSNDPKHADAPIRVHYRNYDASEDEWVSLSDIKSKAAGIRPPAAKAKAKAKARAARAAVPIDPTILVPGTRLQAQADDGVWYTAQVVSTTSNPRFAHAPIKVNYLGYAAEFDEWLGPDRLRSRALRVTVGRFGRAGRAFRPRGVDAQVSAFLFFTVPEDKMDEVKASFTDFYKATRAGTMGCIYFGFSVCDNKICARHSFRDSTSLLAHLAEVKEPLDKVKALVGKDGWSLVVMALSTELEKLKLELPPQQTTFVELDPRSMWFGKKGGLPGKPDTHLSIVSYFTVPKGSMDEIKAVFPGFNRATRAGTRATLYFSFGIAGDEIICREGHKDAETCLQHQHDIKEQVDKINSVVGKGHRRFEVTGLRSDLDKLKLDIGMSALETTFWELDDGSFWR